MITAWRPMAAQRMTAWSIAPIPILLQFRWLAYPCLPTRLPLKRAARALVPPPSPPTPPFLQPPVSLTSPRRCASLAPRATSSCQATAMTEIMATRSWPAASVTCWAALTTRRGSPCRTVALPSPSAQCLTWAGRQGPEGDGWGVGAVIKIALAAVPFGLVLMPWCWPLTSEHIRLLCYIYLIEWIYVHVLSYDAILSTAMFSAILMNTLNFLLQMAE